MGKKRKDKHLSSEPLELVDGYYIPKMIVPAYQSMKEASIRDLEVFFHRLNYETTLVADDGLYLYVIQDEYKYKIELSPKHVSQIDKAIGTNKLLEYIEQIKEQIDG